jgi:cytosine/adenosine deaminase-related metal-dependent hydrolase
MGRRLNQEAAKIIKYAGISEMDAWKMVTLNPAKMLHLDHQTGSIKVGKDADLVLWSHTPLSIEAKALYTVVDGVIYFDREKDKAYRMKMDLERQRLIQKMIEAKQNGEKTEQKVSELDPDYHCEDFE